MYLIEQKSCNLLPQEKKKKCKQINKGDGKCKLRPLSHFLGKNKRKKSFSKS